MKINALDGKVLVNNIEHGERMVGRILLLNDDGKDTGVRARWCRVYSVGKDVSEVSVGDWLLVQHGHWTRGLSIRDGDVDMKIWSINWPDGALAISNKPYETIASNKIVVSDKLDLPT